MAQYFWQPKVADIGIEPSDLVRFAISGAKQTFNVVDTGDGLLACHINGGTNSAGSGLHWTDAAGPGAFADGELYLRIRKNSTRPDSFHSILRLPLNPTTTASIWKRIVHYINYLSSTAVSARAHNGSSTPTTLGTFPGYGTALPLDLHLVIRLSGNQASFKVWKEGGLEPGFTTFTVVGPLGAGYAGFWCGNAADVYVYSMGVSTGSEPAPRASLSTSPPAGTTTISSVTPGETSAVVTYGYSASDQAGFECRINGGAAASIGASPATISGLTALTQYHIEVRAINGSGSGSWSSGSTFTTSAAAPGNTAPSFTGPNIAGISGTQAVALSSLNVSARFSDVESSLTFSAVGAWPAGLTVSSAGVISGTPTTAGTYSGLQVRATDAGALTAHSNAFTITVAAPSAAGINVTEPLRNNTGTLQASLSGLRVAVLRSADLVSVHERSGLTTNGSGILATISDPAIIAGQQYHVVIKGPDGELGITGQVTAS